MLEKVLILIANFSRLVTWTAHFGQHVARSKRRYSERSTRNAALGKVAVALLNRKPRLEAER